MRYSIEIKKFLYSQYFYGGLRIAFGVSFPAVLMLIVFHQSALGFTIATGALGVAVVDMPGPLKYKHNDMLACSGIGFVSALATGIATASPLYLWLTVVPLTFVLSMVVVYGNKWPQISFATLFMMIVTLDSHFTPLQALANASWILAGSLWYTYWSTFVSRWQIMRIEQQALAESAFASADYLRARADFYDLDNDLDEAYRQLVARQVAAVERQDAARDIVLRNLPKLRRGSLDVRRTMLFNLFINSVDLHELFVGAHTDYALVRNSFGDSDLMVFYRDLIRKAASDLEDVGLAILQDRPSRPRINIKAELRAIEYEVEQMRKQDVPTKNPEAYAAVVATYRRLWSASRLIEKMHRNTRRDAVQPDTELRIDQALSHFLSSRRVPLRQFVSNLNMASPSFRHALRVTVAVALGLWLGRLLPLTNAYWIVMTSVIILKPGYSMTKQRNVQRIIGTVIGCTASVALVFLVKQPHILLAVMFASMVMSYSLLLFNYTASVVFTSAYVLILFHLLAPSGIRLIGERAIDTFIGSAIAIAISHVFPYWEYRVMGKLVNGMIASTRKYLEACWSLAGARVPLAAGGAPTGPLRDEAAAPQAVAAETQAMTSAATQGVKQAVTQAMTQAAISAAATPSGLPAVAAAVPANVVEGALQSRLARKHVQVAFANLGQAFQRMMLEPKAQQKFVPEINDLLIQSHAIASQITAAAPLLAGLDTLGEPGQYSLTPLQQALGAVRENLLQAQDGVALPANQPETAKLLVQALDAMVVDAENAESVPHDPAQELKLLAYQCKQMLAASYLIRKDAGVIRLPAG
jgi:uncharacterized membrane protein YccC